MTIKEVVNRRIRQTEAVVRLKPNGLADRLVEELVDTNRRRIASITVVTQYLDTVSWQLKQSISYFMNTFTLSKIYFG